MYPETYTKRQATQHGCLPSLLGDGDKGIEIVYDEEKIVCPGQPRQNKNLLYRHDKPYEPNKKEPLSFVLLESHFTLVTTSQQGPPLSSVSDGDKGTEIVYG